MHVPARHLAGRGDGTVSSGSAQADEVKVAIGRSILCKEKAGAWQCRSVGCRDVACSKDTDLVRTPEHVRSAHHELDLHTRLRLTCAPGAADWNNERRASSAKVEAEFHAFTANIRAHP